MENDDITTISLNPALLRHKETVAHVVLVRYMRDVLYDFYSKMYKKAVDDAHGRPELSANLVYIDRLNKVRYWPQETIEKITSGLEEFASQKHKFFKLRNILRSILSSQLCVVAASENKACSNRIQLNDIHVQELLYDTLKFSAKTMANAPSLFISKRGREFVQREKLFDFVFKRAIEDSIIDFVQRYISRIEDGTIESPLVPIPMAVAPAAPVQPAEEEAAPNFKEIFGAEPGEGEQNPFGAGEEEKREEPDNNEYPGPTDEDVKDPVLDPDKNPNIDYDEKDDKFWDAKRNQPRVYNPDDRLRDDEVRNPQHVSFNEEVEVSQIPDFQKDKVKPILRPYKAPLIRRTYFKDEK